MLRRAPNGSGWLILDKKGRKLEGPYPLKRAQERLRQIEAFAHMDKHKGVVSTGVLEAAIPNCVLGGEIQKAKDEASGS